MWFIVRGFSANYIRYKFLMLVGLVILYFQLNSKLNTFWYMNRFFNIANVICDNHIPKLFLHYILLRRITKSTIDGKQFKRKYWLPWRPSSDLERGQGKTSLSRKRKIEKKTIKYMICFGFPHPYPIKKIHSVEVPPLSLSLSLSLFISI